jgi:hypothetical protein
MCLQNAELIRQLAGRLLCMRTAARDEAVNQVAMVRHLSTYFMTTRTRINMFRKAHNGTREEYGRQQRLAGRRIAVSFFFLLALAAAYGM